MNDLNAIFSMLKHLNQEELQTVSQKILAQLIIPRTEINKQPRARSYAESAEIAGVYLNMNDRIRKAEIPLPALRHCIYRYFLLCPLSHALFC